MKPKLIVQLRQAVKEDFSNPDESKKLNVLYFHQSYYGAIETKPHYFTAETNMREFKTLYAAGQIFVPDAIFYEPVELTD
jgi:hypothetical protein